MRVVKAFEEHAFDYLLGPVEAGRLAKTLARPQQSAAAGSRICRR